MGLMDTPVDQFEPGEIAGMRSAAVVLLSSAVLNVVLLLLTRIEFSFVVAIDVFLGVQLWRLRHSWRAWAMLRAGVGSAVGVLVLVSALTASGNAVVGILLGLMQIAYCASILLLLVGSPTSGRVLAGRLLFGVSVVLMAGATIIALTPQYRSNLSAAAAVYTPKAHNDAGPSLLPAAVRSRVRDPARHRRPRVPRLPRDPGRGRADGGAPDAARGHAVSGARPAQTRRPHRRARRSSRPGDGR